MNCNQNCNQGRNCTCATAPTISTATLWTLAIILLVVMFAGFSAVIEVTLTGAAYWTKAVIASVVLGTAGICMLHWIAEKVIDCIDFMTRWED